MTLMVAVQFSWAAAASYCAHETSAVTATHFGHHAHSHEVVDGAVDEAVSESEAAVPQLQPQLAAELEHGHCHLAHAAMASNGSASHSLPGRTAPPTVDACLSDSHIPAGLDRPNWSRA
jgi:hypothetical protein